MLEGETNGDIPVYFDKVHAAAQSKTNKSTSANDHSLYSTVMVLNWARQQRIRDFNQDVSTFNADLQEQRQISERKAVSLRQKSMEPDSKSSSTEAGEDGSTFLELLTEIDRLKKENESYKAEHSKFNLEVVRMRTVRRPD